MFKETPLTIKVIGILNIVFSLLVAAYLSGFQFGTFYILAFLVTVINLFLSIGLMLLSNRVRKAFIILHILNLFTFSLVLAAIITFGIATEGTFSDRPGRLLALSSLDRLGNWIFALLKPAGLTLFSIFYIFYLIRPKVKERFK